MIFGNSFFEKRLRVPLLENGIRFINPRWNWFRGVTRVLVSKKPIFSPADVNGRRVRVSKSKTLKAYWEYLGAKPVFVPFEKADEALRTGDIDIMPCYKAHAYPMGVLQECPICN